MDEVERSAERAQAVGALRDALARVTGADRRRRGQAPAADALAPTHLRAMWLLLCEGEATAGDLARAAHLHPASVTAMIDQLQGRGLVERRRHAADGRVCIVALTRPGHALVAAQEARTAARLEGALEGVSDDDLRTTARVLGRLTGPVDGAMPSPPPGPGATW